MATCVLVMGGPRAGTSLCAGMLHSMGVHMGDDLGDANEWNPAGFYEDGEFADIYSRMCFGESQGSMETYMPEAAALSMKLSDWHRQAIKSRQGKRSWGVKSARLCYVLREFIAECSDEVKVIRMLRPESEMIASWQARSSVSVEAAAKIVQTSLELTSRAIAECSPQLLDVRYHDLVDNTVIESNRIASFVGKQTTSEALALIDTAFRRFNHG